MGARKHKGRSKRNIKLLANAESESLTKAPHTFVFHRGTRCVNVQSLISDLRTMLEPYTATNLRVTRRNVLKDITAVAGVFHVTHLWIISRSSKNIFLRIAGLPAGPTIKFKISRFATIRDIRRFTSKPVIDRTLFTGAPLLVMSRSAELEKSCAEGQEADKNRHKVYKLISTLMQRSFPSLEVDNVKLSKLKRCVLLYQTGDRSYQLRHYAIKLSLTRRVNGAVRRLLSGRSLPDLSSCSDVSDFVYRPCLSESEDEDTVELPQSINRLHTQGSQSALKLKEIGPRLDLELCRIEDDVCSGNRLWPPKKSADET